MLINMFLVYAQEKRIYWVLKHEYIILFITDLTFSI